MRALHHRLAPAKGGCVCAQNAAESSPSVLVKWRSQNEWLFMETNTLPFEKIIFVCTNERAEGERVCCRGGGGGELRDKLKAMVKARQMRSKVRVSQSGCMDKCEDGPNIMVFPDNVWFSHVTDADLEPLLDAVTRSLETGERLVPPEAMT